MEITHESSINHPLISHLFNGISQQINHRSYRCSPTLAGAEDRQSHPEGVFRCILTWDLVKKPEEHGDFWWDLAWNNGDLMGFKSDHHEICHIMSGWFRSYDLTVPHVTGMMLYSIEIIPKRAWFQLFYLMTRRLFGCSWCFVGSKVLAAKQSNSTSLWQDSSLSFYVGGISMHDMLQPWTWFGDV